MAQRSAIDRVLRTGERRVRLGWRLALFLVLTVLLGVGAGFLLPPGVLSGSVALLAGAVAAGALVLLLDGRPAGALGFYLRREALAETVRGVALGVTLAIIVVGLIAVAGGLRWVGEEGDAWGWLVGGLGALAFLAVPAAAEEALLRGYPLQALAEAWGPKWALALTAGLFGALHLGNPGVTAVGALNVAVAGLFLGIVYLRTLSLWWATGAHLGWNWASGYVADVPVSGLELLDAPLYDGVARGNAWISGGSFGPEGSLLATAVVVVAAALCWGSPWLAPSASASATRPLALGEEARA